MKQHIAGNDTSDRRRRRLPDPGQAFDAFFMDDAYPIWSIKDHLITQDPVTGSLSRQTIPHHDSWNIIYKSQPQPNQR